MKYALVLVPIVIFGGVALWWNREEVSAPTAPTAAINGHVLGLEVVRTPEEQGRGLSDREQLAENAGMLFVYEEPSLPGFWMPDMRFSIDIMWIDENREIVGISENVAPETYPQVFRPPSPVQYVLEVNAGWTAANGITVGDEVVLDF